MDDEPERSPHPSDEELARAAQRGDAAAFDALVRRYLRPAMAVAWQYAGRLEDAEDVVQDAFHLAVRGLERYDASRPFAPWMYAIVRNAARSAGRKAGRREELAPSVGLEREPPAPAADLDAVGDVARALSRLPEMQRACVGLCDIEGYSSVEASVMLGVAEGTVRTHLFRARRALREAVGAAEESPDGL